MSVVHGKACDPILWLLCCLISFAPRFTGMNVGVTTRTYFYQRLQGWIEAAVVLRFSYTQWSSATSQLALYSHTLSTFISATTQIDYAERLLCFTSLLQFRVITTLSIMSSMPVQVQSNLVSFDLDLEKSKRPWQYVGYPGLSQWMASSDDFFTLRRFSKSNARYLLYLQHEIGRRERALEDMDERSRNLPPGQGPCGSFELERMPGRLELIEEIGPLLRQYCELLNSMLCNMTDMHVRRSHQYVVSNPEQTNRR
jgi:hypothetical protein